HIPYDVEKLPHQVEEAFQGVDLILHAGDIYVASVLDELERIAPVLAATGDDDSLAIAVDERVRAKHTLQFEGLILWLTHMRPCRHWVSEQSIDAQEEDIYGDADIVVFGHEHRTVVERHNGVLLISPGSPTFLHYRQGLGTVGILNINSGKVEVDIAQLSQVSGD
ncbi:MAG: YfcE family phosphodiesterase, partial [Dehalococcoidia bacterium]|nr:YfcE family phosphodiesterase [Dehalococcoidia bacterium]